MVAIHMASLDLPALVKSPTAAVFTFASVATLVFARHFTRSSNQLKPLQRYIPSPRDTLIPFLSGKEAAALAYPPSLLPGARDVSTLYGTMRVYEWGPENGKKVVLVHGDTTPGPVLGPIADALVSRGCRVIMFGMFLRAGLRFPCGQGIIRPTPLLKMKC